LRNQPLAATREPWNHRATTLEKPKFWRKKGMPRESL